MKQTSLARLLPIWALSLVLAVALVDLPGSGSGREAIERGSTNPGTAGQQGISLADFCNGTDTKDDTACLQRWLDMAMAQGQELYAPAGVYLYSDAVTLHSGSRIRCAGAGATIFKSVAQSHFLKAEGHIRDIMIEDCGFDVNGNLNPFLSVIRVAGRPVAQNIQVRGNRIFDSAIPGRMSPEQRQYILLIDCESCWIEHNWLSEGGRIKVGRPGRRLIIENNILEHVNDNAITVVDAGTTTSSEIRIQDNMIFDPLTTGIFFGADGRIHSDPALTTLNVIVSQNMILGDWGGACIRGTLPVNAQRVHITNNICTKTGSRDEFTAGIQIGRVAAENEQIPAAKDILIGFNTVTASAPGQHLSKGGIFIAGRHQYLRVIGNEIRDVGPQGLWLSEDIHEAVVADNVIAGGGMSLTGSFDGLIHHNLIVDALDAGIHLRADAGQTMTAAITDNRISHPRGNCIVFQGGGALFDVDLVGNVFADCGSAPSVLFLDGAALAPEALRLQNKGD